MRDLKQVEEVVLTYPPLRDYVAGKIERKNEVSKIIEECHSELTVEFLKKTQKFLEHTFYKVYDGFSLKLAKNLHIGNLAKSHNIVFVPNHQSHADYVALSSLFFAKYKIPIFIAGGINLNIFPIGKIFRKAGCFFIRRSFGKNPIYKLTIEGYIYYLLKNGYPLEFFFEGGRSRTGKLLPPKYGMFQMVIEAHKHLGEDKRPLVFVPISIAHEILPDEKSHSRELKGGKKKKEKSSQLLKLYKVFMKKYGTIHIHAGEPLSIETGGDRKDIVQSIAFRTYRKVGKGMLVTPSALLSMVLLDEHSNALTWEEILIKSKNILNFCKKFDVPISPTLDVKDPQIPLKRVLNILITNNKINIIETLGKVFYEIKVESRLDLLYYKNTILHHFLVVYIMNASWINIMNGSIKDVASLVKFLQTRRKQLKYEFYLPTVKELLSQALTIVSTSIGKEVHSLEDCLKLSTQELYLLAKKIGVFNRSCSYILEAYYIGLQTLKHLNTDSFNRERFLKMSKEVFEMEMLHGRLIKYPESYSTPLIKNSLLYFENMGILEINDDVIEVVKPQLVDDLLEDLTLTLLSQLSFKFKVEPLKDSPVL